MKTVQKGDDIKRLKEDEDFYQACSQVAKNRYETFYHKDIWLNYMNKILNS